MSFKKLVSDLHHHRMMKSQSQRRTSKMLLLKRRRPTPTFRKALDKVNSQLGELSRRAMSDPRVQRKNQMSELRQRIQSEYEEGQITGSQADALRNNLDNAAHQQGIKL